MGEREPINPLVLSYPNFTLGQIIDPDEANQNNFDITNKVNEFIGDVEDALDMAENAEVIANSTIETANGADEKADYAVDIADGADSKADKAIEDSEEALIKATEVHDLMPELEESIENANELVEEFDNKADITYVDQIAENFTMGILPDESIAFTKIDNEFLGKIKTLELVGILGV